MCAPLPETLPCFRPLARLAGGRFLFLFLFPVFLAAQESFVIQSLVSAELPAIRMNRVFQDRQGFIWIGAFDGLYRYDGYGYFRYQQTAGDPHSMSNGMIFDITEDARGNLWLATNGEVNRLDPRTGHFTAFPFPAAGGEKPELRIRGVYADSRGGIWAGTYDGNLYRLDLTTLQWTKFPTGSSDPHAFVGGIARGFHEEAQGYLWIGSGNGLSRYDFSTGEFVAFQHDPNDPFSLSYNFIWSIFEDDEGLLWLGLNGGGINRFDRTTGRFTHFRHEPGNPASLSNNDVYSFVQDHLGRLWIATYGGGLNCFDRHTGRFTSYTQRSPFPHTVNHNQIFNLFKDRQGLIWIATDAGLNRLDFHAKPFKKYFYQADYPFNPSSPEVVTAILEDNAGILWLGTGNGLIRFDRQTGRTLRYQHDPFDSNSLSDNRIWTLAEGNRNDLWVGTWGGGLNRLDIRTGRFTRYLPVEGDSTSVADDQIRYLLKDSDGTIWLSTEDALQFYDEATGRFVRVGEKGTNSCCIQGVNRMAEDRNGIFWMVTWGNGVYRWDRRAGQITHYQYDPANPGGIGGSDFLELFLDADGSPWMHAIGRGLNHLEDLNTGRFTLYSKKDGLPNDQVMSILEDDHRRLWITSKDGLSCFDPRAGVFQNFDVTDGLPSNEYNFCSRFRSRSGELLFGSINGLLAFHPDSIRPDSFRPPVVFTSFTRFNSRLAKNLPIVDQWISGKKSLTLTHLDNVLTFEFAALNFRNPEGNRYAYQLEGFSDQWVPLGAKRDVTFTNLAPGRYTLRVKAANDDGVWNDTPTELYLRVLPPWYWSWLSKTLYLLLLTGILYALYRFQLRRRMALAEARRLQELDAVKTRLYTNISHEFRTPLTVILGMADRALADPENWFREGLRLIRRNGRQLLTLVNQLLDLRKLEDGKMILDLQTGDLTAFLRYAMESFESLAVTKDVRLHFLSGAPALPAAFDADKVQTILSNLLSNAVKFTPPGGDIYLTTAVEQRQNDTAAEWLRLEVRDTGRGIPADQLPHIFDRFYQVDDSASRDQEGTGIGLTLTRELVRLMDGDIQVDSHVGQGTIFTLYLPLIRRGEPLPAADKKRHTSVAYFPDEAGPKQSAAEAPTAGRPAEDAPRLLLVEDNVDVITYLRACLHDRYYLATATNGDEGIAQALATIPDLIISDVMMPGKDGFELCRTLKSDFRTSHIPIILLTAKADQASRLVGLDGGADAYLSKPFDREELLLRVQKLIELRRLLHARYSVMAPPEPTTDRVLHMEDAFLQQLRQTIEAHLDDEDFGIPELCRAVGISRTQLHRKLHALTGKSASHFIRSIRLQHARDLLRSTKLTVSEIAFSVGIPSLSFFSRIYTEYFGETPTESRAAGGQ